MILYFTDEKSQQKLYSNFFFFEIGWLSLSAYSQTHIYISPSGDDSNNGSASAPFRTIERANSLIKSVNKNMKMDIHVYLRGGKYYLKNPVLFSSDLSGSNGFRIVYSSYPGEKAIISGGRRIKDWSYYNDAIVQTSIKNPFIRQLYINDQRAIRSREPDICSYSRLRNINKDSLILEIDRFVDTISSNAEMILQRHWNMDVLRVANAIHSDSTTKLFFQNPEAFRSFHQDFPSLERNQTFHLENDLSFLDSYNEWFLDKLTGNLFFMPQKGNLLLNQRVEIPVLEKLFIIEGSESKPIEGLLFKNLTFELTGWTQPSIEGYNGIQAGVVNWEKPFQPTPSAIFVRNAKNVRVENSQFRNLGGNGIILFSGVKDCQLEGNVLNNISGGGIIIDYTLNGETHILNREPESVCRNIIVKNNYITNIGMDYYGSVGIFVGYGSDIVISNNMLENLPYTAISIGWGWSKELSSLKNIHVTNNLINKAVNMLDDGAGIYLLSSQPGTIIENNKITNIQKSKWAGATQIFGIYLDEGSDYITVTNNELDSASETSIWVSPNAGENNKIESRVSYIATPLNGLEDKYNKIAKLASSPAGPSIDDCRFYNELHYNLMENIADFSLIPNPTSREVNIILKHGIYNDNFEVIITSINNSPLVHNYYTNKDVYLGSVRISLDAKPGIYLVCVKTKSVRRIKRLIVI